MTAVAIDELLGSESSRLSPFRDYRLLRGAGDSAYLSIFSPPSGQVLATVASRVNHFEAFSDDLPSLGLPSRMKDCLVYYACWQLLSQRLAVGQEELKLMSRQTEAGTEERVEVLDGSQVSTQVEDKAGTQGVVKEGTTTEDKAGTQAGTRDSSTIDTKDITVTTDEDASTTEDKTPTQTGTRDSTTTETKAALQQEDTNLEQTEDKNGTTTGSSTESTSDSRSGSSSETSSETGAESSITTTSEDSDQLSNQVTVERSEGTETSDSNYDKIMDGPHRDMTDKTTGGTEVTYDQTTRAVWDDATPAHQESSTTTGPITTVDTTKHTVDDNSTYHDFGYDHADKTTETESLNSVEGTSEDHKTGAQSTDTASTAATTKSGVSGEDNRGTASLSKSDSNVESNLVLNVQEKIATAAEDNVTVFTEVTTLGNTEDNVVLVDKTIIAVTDEDDTSTVAETTSLATTEDNVIAVVEATDQVTTEDNTIQVDQATDNTTTSTFSTTKTTGVESMNTYRDRLQTAQYYKLLLDLEIQNKKMRSWVSRGL